MLIGVFAGKPLNVTSNVMPADVRLPPASRTTFIWMFAVPLPDASGPVIGGVSSAGDSCATNLMMFGSFVGAVGESSEHAPMASAMTAIAQTRFIVWLLPPRDAGSAASTRPARPHWISREFV